MLKHISALQLPFICAHFWGLSVFRWQAQWRMCGSWNLRFVTRRAETFWRRVYVLCVSRTLCTVYVLCVSRTLCTVYVLCVSRTSCIVYVLSVSMTSCTVYVLSVNMTSCTVYVLSVNMTSCQLSGTKRVCAILSSAACQDLQYFSTFSEKSYFTQNVSFDFLYNFCLKHFSF